MSFPSDVRAAGGGSVALTVSERNALLDQLWALDFQHEPRRITELLERLPTEELLAEPEFGFTYARAIGHLGQVGPALDLLQRLLEQPRARLGERLRLRTRIALAVYLIRAGLLSEGESELAEAMAAASAVDESRLIGAIANNQAVVYNIRCRWDDALASLSHAMAAYQQIGDREGVALCHHNLGIVYREMRLLSAADAQFEHALAHRRGSSALKAAVTDSERALLIHDRGDPRLAEATAFRALATTRSFRVPRQEGEVLRVLGVVTMDRDPAAARGFFERSLELAAASGNRLLLAEVRAELVTMAAREGRLEQARTEGEEAVRHYRSLGAEVRAEAVRARMRTHGVEP